jgi:arylsulfatase A-like enzyme
MGDFMNSSAHAPAARRWLASVLGAALAAVPVALLDARWALASTTEQVELWRLGVATLGLIGVIAAAVGAAVGALTLVLHPASSPNWRRAWQWLEAGPVESRAERGALLLAGSVAATLWLVAVLQISLAALTTNEAARVTGTGAAWAAVALGIALGLIARSAAQPLARGLQRWQVPGWLAAASGLGLLVLVVNYGVATGTVGGEGGVLAPFGVLKRPELDLRPVASLAVLAAAAYALPAYLVRAPAWVALGVLGLSSVFPVLTARSALEERRASLAVSRGAPLARLALVPARHWTDRDRDGSSAWFGGGDCNDADAARSPSAEDVPGNGVDEDCSGRDAEKVVLAAPPAPAPKDAAQYIDARLPKNLSLIILMIDAWRGDTAGFMGYPRNVTPNLDRLAKKSVVFERSYSLSSYTGKSVPPMMMGKYGGEVHRGWNHFNKIDPREKPLWTRLQGHGFKTLSAQGYWYFYRKSHGFDRGWDVLDTQASPTDSYEDKDVSVVGPAMAERSIAVLSGENVRDRFFFWNHWVDPHADYIEHEEFKFGRKQRDLYDGEIAFTDHQIGRVLDHLEKTGLFDRSIIVVTSDHGEAFGEHGMVRHGFELWEELVWVPLIIHVPGIEPHRVKVRRSAVDLVPTLLDLLRLPHPSGQGADFFSGRSMIHDLYRPPGYVPEERIVFIDMQAGPYNDERQAFIENGMKLITGNGVPQGLYDLEKDPGETRDLLENRELRERYVTRYRAYRKSLREVFVKPGERQ